MSFAHFFFYSNDAVEIFGMLTQRMNDKGKNWRHVMKSLIVLEYLLLNGSETVVLWAKDNIYIIKTLHEFQYIDDVGLDQGQNVRTRAKSITSLLSDSDNLRNQRKRRHENQIAVRSNHDFDDDLYAQGISSRPTQPRARPSVGGVVDDEEMRRAIEQSKLTAEEEERRRRSNIQDDEDEDLRKAIMLSKEEDEQRQIDQEHIFQTSNTNENLIDMSQPDNTVQYQYTAQPPFMTGLYDMNGNPSNNGLFQQPVSTGYIQNMYSMDTQYTAGLQQQQQQPNFGFDQHQNLQQPQHQATNSFSQLQQPQEQQPLAPMKTGSNNPFAQFSQPTPFDNGPSLNDLQNQYQQQYQQPQQTQQQQYQQQQTQQQQPLKPVHTGRSQQVDDLNNLLGSGDGIDTYGNAGDTRLPAHHTRTPFVNAQITGHHESAQNTSQPGNNPFVGTQYNDMATNGSIQPAFTGYGFGNAQQSQQTYQTQQQLQNANRPQPSLIDL